MLDQKTGRAGPRPFTVMTRAVITGPDPQHKERAPSAHAETPLTATEQGQDNAHNSTLPSASVAHQPAADKGHGQMRRRARQWPPRPQRSHIQEYRHAISRRSPCPICDGRDECLRRDFDSGEAWVWCVRRGVESGGLPLPNWGYRVVHFFLIDATGTLRDATEEQLAHAEQGEQGGGGGAAADPEPLPIEQRDEALRLIAQLLGQDEIHRAKLAARGYDLAACAPGGGRHLFASLPANHALRAEIVSHLIASLAWLDETALRRLPGISRKGRGAWAFLPHVEGTALLEFRRDELGRIWGFEYAPDTLLDTKKKRLWPSLQASGLHIDQVHVARPRQDACREIWLAEGGHKANLLADARAAVALASLGKGNWRHFLPALEQLDPKRLRRIVIALDTDAWGEAATEVALIHELRRKGWRLALARWDAAAAKGPDDALVAGLPIELREPEPDPRQEAREALRRRRTDRRVTVLHDWQRISYDTQARTAEFNAMLRRGADALQEHAHRAPPETNRAIEADETLAIVFPPGAGKTSLIAELGRPTTLGQQLNIGLVAQRRDMAEAVDAFRQWNMIEPCSPDYEHGAYCPNGALHTTLAQKSYNARAAHQAHHDTYGHCQYEEQFDTEASAIYQLAHVATSYVAGHELTVVDEVSFADWLPVIQVTIGKLKAVMPAHKPESYLARFIGALEAVIAEHQPLHGRALFDALDGRLGGHLYETLTTLAQDGDLTNERPWFDADGDPDKALALAEAAPPVVLPQTLNAFTRELMRWRRGGDWNSQLQIQPVAAGPHHKGEWGLHITRRREFGRPRHGGRAPLAILDATADDDLLTRLFHRTIRVQRETIAPAAHTRHIAIRTGKRYAKTALASEHGLALARSAREVEYRLREFDPDGAKRRAGLVGLITYQGAEAALATLLHILPERTLHFWGCRGSNLLEDCEILVMVGTPLLPSDELARMARALWDDDAEPIIEGVRCDAKGHALKDDSGRVLYHDSRMQQLSDYLTEAELAQCAHRIRPLRHDGRVILSYAVAGELAYLPATEIMEGMPLLSASAQDRAKAKMRADGEKLERALVHLQARGLAVNVHTLRATSNLRMDTVSAWWAAYKQRQTITAMNQATEQPQTRMNSGENGLRKKLPSSHIKSFMGSGKLFALIPPTGIHAGSVDIGQDFTSPGTPDVARVANETHWKGGA